MPPPPATSSSAHGAGPSARVAALKLLAQRRLSEAQLHERLRRRGYADDEVTAAVASCVRDGLVDDRLFATLYVEGRRAPVGDARLVAELVKRGIDPDAARERVGACSEDEGARIDAAYARMRRTQPALSYQSAARKLERMGFPAALIYRTLRAHAANDLSEVLGDLL